jgi:excisionase family DNA binding protein
MSMSQRRNLLQESTVELITVRPAQAARITGLSRSSLYEAMADGSLPSAKVRGCRVIFLEDLRGWLQRERQVKQGLK